MLIIEPNFGPLQSLLTNADPDQPDVIGSLIVNLVLAVAMLVTIVAFVGGIIVDQYPCWIGVPNCD